MSGELIIIAAIVLGAVAFLLRRLFRTKKAGHGGAGCENCSH
jgi:hypothetical protein